MSKKKVYIVIEDWTIFNDDLEDFSSNVMAVFAKADDAKEFINKQPEFYEGEEWTTSIDKDGWIVEIRSGDENYKYRVIEEEVK